MLNPKTLIAAGTLAALACGCTDVVPDLPSSEIYTREWVKTFGVINGSNDWNNATRGSVSVDVPGGSNVKVTALVGGKNYLLANYSGVSGSRTLAFDMPRGVKDITVQCGAQRIATTVGGKVAFGGSRATIDPSQKYPECGVTASLCTDESEWWVVPFLNATVFRRKMPEAAYNIDREGVTTDFMFKFTDNEFILRPLFWDTSHFHRLGMFYLDENDEPVRIPLYDMDKVNDYSDDLVLSIVQSHVKEAVVEDYTNDEELMRCFADNGVVVEELSSRDNFDTSKTTAMDDRHVTFAARQYLKEVKGLVNSRDAAEDGRFNYVYRWRFDGDDRFIITYTYFDYDTPEAPTNGQTFGGTGKTQEHIEAYKSLVSKGIRVHVDDISREYGFYILSGWNKNDFDYEDQAWFQGDYFYSLSSLNKGVRWQPKEGAVRGSDGFYADSDFESIPERRTPRAATWVGEKYDWRYLSFEDGGIIRDGENYNRGTNDFDMQDIVFLLDGIEPVEIKDKDPDHVPEPEPVKWLIACEDLGDKDDFDFNDVVFEVSHVAGETKAYITPLAAGGTLETYLMRVDESGQHLQIGNEWHLNCGGKDFKSMINTTALTFTPGEEHVIAIDVPEDFTITSDPTTADSYRKNMGGFYLRVLDADGNVTTEVTAPGAGEAPQMILLYQEDGKWFWPVERTRISVAYEDFPEWASNPIYDVVNPGERRWYHKRSDVHVIKR
ncbi:MAG: hypothetical protein K2L74_05615 [Muribaculaceae bacterium]|nr:hypothetical protein [Muribaculaceae bacterium]